MRGLLSGTLEEQLDQLVEKARERPTGWNLWLIDAEDRELYVRYSRRLQDSGYEWTLQLANMSFPEELRGKGRLIRFLDHFESYSEWLEIENLFCRRHVEFFARRGYERRPVRYGDFPVSMFRRPLDG